MHAAWDGKKEAFFSQFNLDEAVFQQFLDFAVTQGIHVDGFSARDIMADRAFLEARIKARLAVRIFDLEAYYPVMHKEDRTYQEAISLWDRAEQLATN